MSRPGLDLAEARREPVPGLRTYRRLLALYPRAFREEFGDEMIDAFCALRRDRPRGFWRLMARDLVVSLGREHGSVSRLVSVPMLFVAVALVVTLGLTGRFGDLALAFGVFVVLPTVAVVGLRSAWASRRIGLRAWPRALAATALLVPAGFGFATAGDSTGWLIGMVGGLALISGGVVGVIWAVDVFVSDRRSPEAGPERRRRARWVVVGAVAAIGFVAGASYNSYRKSQPPPGDHSVANASAGTAALWEAAYAGDVAEVERLVAACADPFVQFSGHGLTDFRARSAADHQRGGWGNGDPVPDAVKPRYDRVVTILQRAEDTWTERCNAGGAG